MSICTFLPGKLLIEQGTARDYFALERFHYVPKRPATYATVYRLVHHRAGGAFLAGVGVMSYPVPCSRGRQLYFDMENWSFAKQLRFANANLRTISRVVIHPQYRAIGLASALVRHMIAHCPTPYIEASARMGRVHPFFEKAGMLSVPMPRESPAYYIARTPSLSGRGSG